LAQQLVQLARDWAGRVMVDPTDRQARVGRGAATHGRPHEEGEHQRHGQQEEKRTLIAQHLRQIFESDVKDSHGTP